MKKVTIKIGGLVYHDHYFIDSIESYSEYLNELNNRFAVSESEIINLKTFVGHGYSLLTGISGMLHGMSDDEVGRKEILFNLKLLQGKIISDQLSNILKGYILVINDKGGYFPIKKDEKYIIIENTKLLILKTILK